jgi:hypothetical protein
VAAGGHGTFLRASDGALLVCGDNQFGPLGLEGPPLVPVARPTRVPGAVVKGTMSTGGAHSAFSPDGCSVRITGDNDQGIVSAAGADSRVFVARADASLCAPAPAAPLPDLVRIWPSGGASGCWTPRVQENAVSDPKWAPLRQTLLAIEELFRKNPAFMNAPEPSRWRTTIAAGPQNESGAQLHIKVVHERKADGTRVWTGECDVIPQVDRIGGAIAQMSIYINEDPRGRFIGPVGEAPKRTGTVAGFPEYNGAVYITKDNRVSWIPQTLDDKLTVEGAKRERALAEWTKSRAEIKGMDDAAMQKAYDALKATDPAGADRFVASVRQQNAELQRLQQDVYPLTTAELQKQVNDYRQYRASFTPEQLRAPAVWGDPSGEARKRLDARIAELQALTPEEQAATRQPGADVRTIRQRHLEKASPLMEDARAQYNLTNLKPGDAAQAMSVKPDPAFPDFTTPNRIQSITILFSFGDPKNAAMAAWGARTKETFDFAALAALIK